MNNNKIPQLETKRLHLEPLGIKFLTKKYLSWMRDIDVIKYLESGGRDYTKEMLEKYLENIETNKIFSWAIILKSNKSHIGNIKIDPIDKKNLIGEYGIMIGDKSAWGNGYAKETSKEVLNFCFQNLLLNKVSLGVRINNREAIKLYQNLGFVEVENYSENFDIKNYKRMIVTNKIK